MELASRLVGKSVYASSVLSGKPNPLEMVYMLRRNDYLRLAGLPRLDEVSKPGENMSSKSSAEVIDERIDHLSKTGQPGTKIPVE